MIIMVAKICLRLKQKLSQEIKVWSKSPEKAFMRATYIDGSCAVAVSTVV